MSEAPEGPGWWQASDYKWYPPEQGSTYVAPVSPPAGTSDSLSQPIQPPVTPAGRSGLRAGLILAVLALALTIAVLVAGRVYLGAFLPGYLLVGVVLVLGVMIALRTGRSAQRKAVLVTAMVIVVALAVPASLELVYPAYDHFFPRRSIQASESADAPSAVTPSSSPSSHPSASALPASGAGDGATPSWNVVINGQTFDQNGESASRNGFDKTSVTCGHDPIHIVVGGGTGLFVNLIEGTLQVQEISLADPAGNTYLYDPRQTVYHWGGGEAQATSSGKSYKVTGTIAPYMNVQGQTQKDATPVPFEFDATCP